MYDLTITSKCEHALENWEAVILCVKYRQKIYVQNHENMEFPCNFLLNMLENDDSNL